MKVGAWALDNRRTEFIVWAPLKKTIELKIISPGEQTIKLKKNEKGYWSAVVLDLLPDSLYVYLIDGQVERPDPASFYQPDGVHNPSAIIDHALYKWGDHKWQGVALEEMIIYELHTGTFTDQGTFQGIAGKLDHFKKLGINAIEIMPIAQFPGDRNWGYDGVYPFAVQNSYGNPDELKQLIDQCHQQGIAVILDVVYNHLGPEGNYLGEFAPYFTEKYQTPWGWAINFDDKYSDGVRNYFIQNALYWFECFHIDGLRLDAVHGIFDFSAKHILKQLAEKVEEYSSLKGRRHYLIAESNLNDSKIIESKENNGYGNDAQWLDDFHHCLRTIITKDQNGYYSDFGSIKQLAKAYEQGFVFDGGYSMYRKKNFNSSSKHLGPKQFIVFNQNHDQIGNRMKGERLSDLLDFEAMKLAAGAIMFSPYIPMLFMGEEFLANSPFLYFISHLDEDLVKAVQAGRKEEFSAFDWQGEPPDPFAQQTYLQTKLKWGILNQKKHALMFAFYKEIISIRKNIKALKILTRQGLKVSYSEQAKTIALTILVDNASVLCCFNFSDKKTSVPIVLDGKNKFKKLIDSADQQWGGPGTLSKQMLFADSDMYMQPNSFIILSL